MTCPSIAEWKRGTDFKPTIVFSPTESGPQTLEGLNVGMMLMDSAGRRFEAVIEVAEDGLRFTAFWPRDKTALWALGLANLDIRVGIDDLDSNTTTDSLMIVDQITTRTSTDL